MKLIKASVVGLGFGETHLKYLSKIKFCKIINIFDFDKKNANYFEKKYKTKFAKNFKETINNKKINFISIASYDNYHFSMIVSAIKNKINIFVEKPLCQTFNQLLKLKKMLNSKKYSSYKMGTNMVLRGHPKFQKIYKIINSGKLGKIYHIEGEYNYGRFYKLTHGWRGQIPLYSVTLGGGIHIIDLFYWIVKSKFEKVTALGNRLNSKKTNFRYNDTVTALVKFKNGVTGKITSNFSIKSPHHHVLNIHGNKGSIFVSKEHCYIYNSNKKKSKKKIIKYKNGPNYKEFILKNFISNIIGKKKLLITKETIFHVMCTSLSIEKSLKSKKWEKIKF